MYVDVQTGGLFGGPMYVLMLELAGGKTVRVYSSSDRQDLDRIVVHLVL
jgi:hypothetical protein